jgi:hypothetical protein
MKDNYDQAIVEEGLTVFYIEISLNNNQVQRTKIFVEFGNIIQPRCVAP